MRMKLTFERTAKVIEKGFVEVDIDGTSSVSDVYKKAFDKQHKAFLVEEREYLDEDWEYAIVRYKEEPDDAG